MKMKRVYEFNEEDIKELLRNHVLDRYEGLKAESVVVKVYRANDGEFGGLVEVEDARG